MGNLIGGGTGGAPASAWIFPEPPESIDRSHRVSAGRSAARPPWCSACRPAWLDRDMDGRREGIFRLNLAKAFDLLFYLNRVTAACPK
jgi:hypothetical protein